MLLCIVKDAYFQLLEEKARECYEIATLARKKGFDPDDKVETSFAKDLADRVEELVGPRNISHRIRQYLKEKTILIGGFILLAIVTFFIPLTQQLWVLFLIQGLAGLGSGLTYPILTGLALKTVPEDQRATAMGFYHSLYAGGMALGPILAGLIGQRWGLPAIFLFSGLFSCAGAVLTWARVKDS